METGTSVQPILANLNHYDLARAVVNTDRSILDDKVADIIDGCIDSGNWEQGIRMYANIAYHKGVKLVHKPLISEVVKRWGKEFEPFEITRLNAIAK